MTLEKMLAMIKGQRANDKERSMEEKFKVGNGVKVNSPNSEYHNMCGRIVCYRFSASRCEWIYEVKSDTGEHRQFSEDLLIKITDVPIKTNESTAEKTCEDPKPAEKQNDYMLDRAKKLREGKGIRFWDSWYKEEHCCDNTAKSRIQDPPWEYYNVTGSCRKCGSETGCMCERKGVTNA